VAAGRLISVASIGRDTVAPIPAPAPMYVDPALRPAFDALREYVPAREEHSGLGELVFLVNGTCNMACTYCYANQGEYEGQPAQQMSVTAAVAGTDLAVERFGTVRTVKLLGGEPSLNPAAIDAICSRFVEHRQAGRVSALPRYGTISNLLQLSAAFIDVVRRHQLEITVSIDGPAEVHDRLRPARGGRGTFDRIVGNVTRLQEETGQPVGVECVYTPLHHALGISPLELSTFLHDLRIPQVLIHPLVDVESLQRYPAEQVRSYVANLRPLQRANMSAEVLRMVRDDDASPALVRAAIERVRARSRWHCGMGQTTFTIDVSGGVWSCYMCIGLEGHRLGSVVGEGEPADLGGVSNRREAFAKETHPICRQCELREPCTGCLGQMFRQAEDGHAFAPIRSTCEWLAGTIDGVLEGLLLARDSGGWDRLLDRLDLQDVDRQTERASL
jgi:uncharacterized protein